MMLGDIIEENESYSVYSANMISKGKCIPLKIKGCSYVEAMILSKLTLIEKDIEQIKTTLIEFETE